MTEGLGQTAIHSACFTNDHAFIAVTICMVSPPSQSVYGCSAMAAGGSTLRDQRIEPLSCRHKIGACLSLSMQYQKHHHIRAQEMMNIYTCFLFCMAVAHAQISSPPACSAALAQTLTLAECGALHGACHRLWRQKKPHG